MENQWIMIVAGIIFFIVSFLLGCWYARWKSGSRKEKDYDYVMKQFRKYEKDDEYKKLKQKLTDEISTYNISEQSSIVVRRLYEIKRQKKRSENGSIAASCIGLPVLVLGACTADSFFTGNHAMPVFLGGGLCAVIYIIIVLHNNSVGMRCYKAVCILEDVLKEFGDGTAQKKRETANTDDINELVNTLKPAKRERALSDIL